MEQIIDLQCADGDVTAVPVLDVPQVVALEQRIAQDGTSLLELMTRAGTALAHAAEAHVADSARIVILAGSGNNGGDGWVAARMLADAGYEVALVSKVVASELAAEPAHTAALEAQAAGNFEVAVAPSAEELARLLDSAELIIDAILGTGFAHDQVREPYASWIRLANVAHDDNGTFLIAADCPSGLNAQTGAAAADCVAADMTVTMIVPKTGLLDTNAQTYVGTLVLAPLVSIEEYCDDLL